MQRAPSLIILTGGVLLATSIAVAQEKAGQDRKASAAPKARVGEAAPDFELVDCCGTKHKLSDYKDKILVLEWVNQQCPWSVKSITAVKDIRKKYEGKNVVWLGIESTSWRKAEENHKWVADKELKYTVLMDTDGKVGRLYGAKTTPHVYIIEKGKLVYAGALHNNQQGDKKDAEVRNYVDEALAAIVAGKAVPVAETTPWGCTVKYKGGEGKPSTEGGEPRKDQAQNTGHDPGGG